MNKNREEKAESLLGIIASEYRKQLKWRLENVDNPSTLDDIMRTQKKRQKRIEDDRHLKEIAELFRSIGDEKRAKRIETSRYDVVRVTGERRAVLEKKFSELLEDRER